MTNEELQKALIDAIKSRAMFYWDFYNEFAAEIGAEKAAAVMKRAIYKRGLEIGKAFRQHGPDDLAGLKDDFLAHIPAPHATFNPEVHSCTAAALDITLHTCPLRDAWQEAGLSDAEVELMTDIAGQVDKGTFEGAGFSFDPDTWKPGRASCCHLKILPGKK
jgi:hypothetical protein